MGQMYGSTPASLELDTYIHGCMYNASQKFDQKPPSAVNSHNDVPFYCRLPRRLARNLCCRELAGGAALGLTCPGTKRAAAGLAVNPCFIAKPLYLRCLPT